jgi:cell division protein FtsL
MMDEKWENPFRVLEQTVHPQTMTELTSLPNVTTIQDEIRTSIGIDASELQHDSSSDNKSTPSVYFPNKSLHHNRTVTSSTGYSSDILYHVPIIQIAHQRRMTMEQMMQQEMREIHIILITLCTLTMAVMIGLVYSMHKQQQQRLQQQQQQLGSSRFSTSHRSCIVQRASGRSKKNAASPHQTDRFSSVMTTPSVGTTLYQPTRCNDAPNGRDYIIISSSLRQDGNISPLSCDPTTLAQKEYVSSRFQRSTTLQEKEGESIPHQPNAKFSSSSAIESPPVSPCTKWWQNRNNLRRTHVKREHGLRYITPINETPPGTVNSLNDSHPREDQLQTSSYDLRSPPKPGIPHQAAAAMPSSSRHLKINEAAFSARNEREQQHQHRSHLITPGRIDVYQGSPSKERRPPTSRRQVIEGDNPCTTKSHRRATSKCIPLPDKTPFLEDLQLVGHHQSTASGLDDIGTKCKDDKPKELKQQQPAVITPTTKKVYDDNEYENVPPQRRSNHQDNNCSFLADYW